MSSPLPLLTGFEWSELDLLNDDVVTELYTLLANHYVEDLDAQFRFDYSIPLIRWALSPPGYRKELHLGVRVKGKLVAFISATPAMIRIHDKTVKIEEINFLCIHKKLRNHRLAPVLISELIRRSNLTGVYQAIYTAGIRVTRPETQLLTQFQYWHRPLNSGKLLDIGFYQLNPRITRNQFTRLYRLPEVTRTIGLRPMIESDISPCSHLFSNYMKKYDLSPVFTEEEFAHWMAPRKDVIYTYVVENKNTITDIVSFFCLSSTVVNNAKFKEFKAAYSYYTVITKTDPKQLLTDVLILARALNCDVFNSLNLVEYRPYFPDLKFNVGTGVLHYYLHNCESYTVSSDKIGLILI